LCRHASDVELISVSGERPPWVLAGCSNKHGVFFRRPRARIDDITMFTMFTMFSRGLTRVMPRAAPRAAGYDGSVVEHASVFSLRRARSTGAAAVQDSGGVTSGGKKGCMACRLLDGMWSGRVGAKKK